MKREESGRKLISDVQAMALGCTVGLVGGAGLGVCVAYLLGGLSTEMAMIIVHISLAMTVMGAWTAPTLVPMAPDA